jgi:ribonuclease BN (tRNA processing enzyme)
MKLTVLGSGSTVPHPRRASSSYWLETSGGSILLDCAATVPHRMAAYGLDWPNLSAVWISHFHMDHCGGIGPLLAGIRHAAQMKARETPLLIYGPPGIAKLIDDFAAVYNYKLLEQPFPIEVVEVEELSKFEILPGLEAVAVDTPHTHESHALHLRDGETTLVFSSDTGFDQKLAALGRNASLFILECTFFAEKLNEKHLNLSEAIYLIRKAKPQRAMLTHFYPEWDDVDFDAEVRPLDPRCEVLQAEDGLVVEI